MKVPELEVFLEDLEIPWLEGYRAFLLQALESLGAVDFEVSVILCRDSYIRKLNHLWRSKDEATDVLSFEAEPQQPPGAPERPRSGGCYGDLVISMDTLAVNSAYFCVDRNEELKRVSLHGLLHLMGWDHASNDASEPMLQHQESILARFKELSF